MKQVDLSTAEDAGEVVTSQYKRNSMQEWARECLFLFYGGSATKSAESESLDSMLREKIRILQIQKHFVPLKDCFPYRRCRQRR